ncbi:DNA-binding CsgD family transcriptional regulator [Crossiella equi]|uniref:DNA-binding CsgD family transcriptional regulator n=1 Tax=Crossiella equi TaxID=130796 RepID=A0ABS5AMH7_9PSEU|nr:LuxR family transcriptional regulator [Crossiella equi]MBP2477773.1 DNA-binding CsgD family transcriptional regulator [Crossiella equi]
MELLGRDLERKQLAELVDGVAERGGALLVTGEPGIGKSALLAHARQALAGARVRVLTATGAEPEQHLAFAGLHQLLYPLRGFSDRLPQAQRDALRTALGLADGAPPEVYLVGLAVLNLLAEAAVERPLVLFVDDLHWVDHASREVLAFLARRLESEPVVLVLSTRDGGPELAGVPELRLAPLPRDVAGQFLPGLTPPERDRVLDAALGNPLALTELGQRPGDGAGLPLTQRLERAFTARAAGLPPETRRALLVAAVNDSAALAEVVAAGGDLGPAVAAGLVDVHEGTVTFRHPLVRSALTHAAGTEARRQAHLDLAEVLTGQPDRVAWHRAEAAEGEAEDVAAALVDSAGRALRRGGTAAALTALERAARLSAPATRAGRLLRTAELAVDAGQRDVVDRLLTELSTTDLTPRQRALATWLPTGFDDGVRAGVAGPVELAGLARQVARDGDLDLAMRILWSTAMRCFWVEPGPEARQHILEVADEMPVDPGDPRIVAVNAYLAPLARGARVVAALRGMGEGIAPHECRFLGSAALQVGAFEESARFSAAAQPGLRADGRLGLLTRALAVQATSCARLGDLATAAPAAEEAARLAEETRQPYMVGLARAVQAEIAALRGEYGHAEALAAEAERVGLAAGARPVLATAQLARGLAALGQGRYADAYNALARLHDPRDPAFQLALRGHATAELAEAAARCDQAAQARVLLRGLPPESSPALAHGLRHAHAVLAPDSRAEKAFGTALAEADPGWPLERGRVRLAFGEWLRRQRRAAESRTHLRAAAETFTALGVTGWAERARRELRAAGEAVPERCPDRVELTAHELSIAGLAAEGLTNREIGQRLFLSHRTVSTHLHRIFPKLGVTARGELAAALRTR